MFFGRLSLILLVVIGASFADGNEDCPNIISREEWGAQSPIHTIPLTNPVSYTIIYHTMTQPCFVMSECVLRVRVEQTFRMEAYNWDDIGYSFLIGGDGNVYTGRGWTNVGAHTFEWNYRSLGIAFIGTYDDVEPSQKMMDAARKLIACGKANGALSNDVKVIGARQVRNTTSPGDKVYAQIKNWPEWVPLDSLGNVIENVTTNQRIKFGDMMNACGSLRDYVAYSNLHSLLFITILFFNYLV